MPKKLLWLGTNHIIISIISRKNKVTALSAMSWLEHIWSIIFISRRVTERQKSHNQGDHNSERMWKQSHKNQLKELKLFSPDSEGIQSLSPNPWQSAMAHWKYTCSTWPQRAESHRSVSIIGRSMSAKST